MTVTEALKILQAASRQSPRFEAVLACGFTPLHLRLFLSARLQERLPNRAVEVKTGLYGNLAGTLEELAHGESEAVACAIEWPDLDPRLGYREAGSWSLAAVNGMVNGARGNLERIANAIARIPAGVRVAVAMPTLPLPPVFHTAGWQASQAELLLEETLSAAAAAFSDRRGTVLVNARRLNEESAPAARLDLKSDLATGLPYALPHADCLAHAFARLLVPPAAKKGIVTDLDDTLWHGIVGELGVDGVSWDLASHHQAHGLYQKLLASLADAGILVAIASKNDGRVVEQALRRTDLLVSPSQIFPVEAHWQAKSGSVARILDTWNVGADAVVFVDDSPMELAEVAAGHPGITCMRFPVNEPAAIPAFLRALRDLCGRERISGDDALRLESIRRGAAFKQESADAATPEDFLRAAGATLTIHYGAGFADARALELVNKTNQFNINGARYSESDWKKRLDQPGAFLMVVSYEDKFGPLGKIGVIQGRALGDVVRIETWVMSCRAFARRIEYGCLRLLFERTGAAEMEIDFAPTAKNSPAQDFFGALLGAPPVGAFSLSGAVLEEKCPPLYHHVCLTGSAAAEALESVEING